MATVRQINIGNIEKGNNSIHDVQIRCDIKAHVFNHFFPAEPMALSLICS